MLRPSDRNAPPPDEARLAILLSDVLRLVRHDFAIRAAGTSLTPALWRLLFHVERNEGGRQTDLAERLDLTPVTVGRMIDRLEKQQLVRRVADAQDRRASRVYLGRLAGPMIERLHEIARGTNERATFGLDPDTLGTLLSSLARVRANLQDARLAPEEPRRAGGDDGR
jgi:MarR family transcriptional regulator, transcriptional regulator for hemolysin